MMTAQDNAPESQPAPAPVAPAPLPAFTGLESGCTWPAEGTHVWTWDETTWDDGSVLE